MWAEIESFNDLLLLPPCTSDSPTASVKCAVGLVRDARPQAQRTDDPHDAVEV